LKLLPWEYLFLAFNKLNFPDLFDAMWIGSLILLVILIVVYMLRTRALHRHRLYLDMWEWLFWSGLITFFLLVVGALFSFDFIVILLILVSGLGAMVYARFLRFPPLFEAYEHQLARQRYLARARSARPEATIRSKRPSGRRGGKRR
jgi:small-conductance mechanosensitive channel